MRLIRFLARSYFDDRIVEPGEELLVADDVVLGSHMHDLSNTGPNPGFAPRVVPVFRSELAHSPAPSNVVTWPTPPAAPGLSPDELRVKATEEAIARAEATRQAEAVPPTN